MSLNIESLPKNEKKIFVAGGSLETELVAEYMHQLRRGGWWVTCDWTQIVELGFDTSNIDEQQRLAKFLIRKIQLARVMWVLLPKGKSEGASFEMGFFHGMILSQGLSNIFDRCLVVSGEYSENGRLYPAVAAHLYGTHEIALERLLRV